MAHTQLDLTSGEQVQGILPVANGGTGGSSQSAAQTGLGLVIGTNVQAFCTTLTTWAGKTPPSGTVVGTTDTQTLSGKTLTNPTINGYVEGVQALGTVTSAATIGAPSSGTQVTSTLTTATPCTFMMPSASGAISFEHLVKQPASGTPTTATWTGVKWPGGVTPTVTPTLGQLDIYSFVSDGTNWYGTYVQGYTY